MFGASSGESSRGTALARFAALGVLVVAAVVLRSVRLDSPTLFVDEAESAVNALTILEQGYPADSYLGLPIFENTLLHFWPEHPEYEFRDASYSSRGVAVFHGWLPLYSMALSFKAMGIENQEPEARSRELEGRSDSGSRLLAPGFTREEMSRRTVAARLPAVVFGGLFVIALYLAGTVSYGRDAGLIAAAAGALASPVVRLGRQARYYSLTLLLTTLCVWVLWLMFRRGRWPETAGAAVLFVLLFHTHVLSFVVACVGWGLLLPWLIRHEGGAAKSAVFATVVVAGVVPWVVLTGFLEVTSVPAARSLLVFPDDYLSYLVRHWKASVLVAGSVGVVGAAWLLGRGGAGGEGGRVDSADQRRRRSVMRMLPAWPGFAAVWRPWLDAAGVVTFLAGWLVVGYLAFLLLMPAPSAFYWRSTLSMQGPGLVLAGVLVAAAVRMVVGQPAGSASRTSGGGGPQDGPSCWIGPALVVVVLVVMPGNLRGPLPRVSDVEPVYELAEYLHAQALPAEARIYAIPYQHLPLQFYTGLPVQSVAPVRKRFLDEYPHEVLILETVFRGSANRGEDPLWDNPAMFRGYEVSDRWGFWQMFFYRFVDPQSRMGENLNYADRVRGARAVRLSSSWVVYHCPPLDGGKEERW